MTLSKAPATFKGFDGYTFRNPASSFENSEYSLFDTTLDGNGYSEVAFNLPAAQDAPGLLQAFIVTSVLESGGDESFTTQTVPYSPFPAYVGVKLPAGDLETDKDNTVQVAVVDATGARLAGRELEYRVFKTEWSWWWDNNPSELAGYVNGRNAKPVASGKLTSGSQDVTFNLRAAEADWGRYLVVVRDVAGGHIAGQTVVIDWPAYKGRSGREDPSALSMLTFAADKDSYRAGDKAKVYIPAAQGGQALVSLENAAGVIAREWVATDASKDTPYHHPGPAVRGFGGRPAAAPVRREAPAGGESRLAPGAGDQGGRHRGSGGGLHRSGERKVREGHDLYPRHRG